MSNGWKERFEKEAGKAAEDADAQLEGAAEKLMAATTVDLEELRPEVNDPETYDRLVAVVQEATQRNLKVAQLTSRIAALGDGAVSLAKNVSARLPV